MEKEIEQYNKDVELANDLLLNFFDKNKEACIRLYYLHPHNRSRIPCDISLERLCEIIRLKIKRDEDALHMD
jgi:hypothetical protein